MMQVAFLTGEYPPMQGGIADHTSYLARYLAPLDVTAVILTGRRWLETAPDREPPQNEAAPVFPVVPNWSWRCWPAVTQFLNTHRPGVLHIQYQAAAFDLGGWVNWLPWYLKKRQIATRLVVTFHDLRQPYIFPKAGRFRQHSMLALARYSHGVICTNREDLQTLHSTPGIPARMVHIPLGSNVDPQPPPGFDRHAWRQQYGALGDTLLLAYFGFLNESKGGEELIEALALLRGQGVDARLLFIGGDVGHADPTNVAYARRVQGLVEQHGLEGVVYRTGYTGLAQVSANLLAADVVVMPYRDGVSFRRTTLIAALRHGCPVVSTTPANPALMPEIQNGQNMLLVPPKNPAALAKAIARLNRDTALRARLSEGARALGNLFDWSRIAEQTAELYRAVTRD